MYTVNYTIYIKNVKRDFFLSIIISTIILNRFKKIFLQKINNFNLASVQAFSSKSENRQKIQKMVSLQLQASRKRLTHALF